MATIGKSSSETGMLEHPDSIYLEFSSGQGLLIAFDQEWFEVSLQQFEAGQEFNGSYFVLSFDFLNLDLTPLRHEFLELEGEQCVEEFCISVIERFSENSEEHVNTAVGLYCMLYQSTGDKAMELFFGYTELGSHPVLLVRSHSETLTSSTLLLIPGFGEFQTIYERLD